ncbi:hypothetical protein HYV74_01565 [Candidatus Uhrbacteria bacterium]|nr:hypothetical protein [Candidatus Uhrbacteria bacterium]
MIRHPRITSRHLRAWGNTHRPPLPPSLTAFRSELLDRVRPNAPMPETRPVLFPWAPVALMGAAVLILIIAPPTPPTLTATRASPLTTSLPAPTSKKRLPDQGAAEMALALRAPEMPHADASPQVSERTFGQPAGLAQSSRPSPLPAVLRACSAALLLILAIIQVLRWRRPRATS